MSGYISRFFLISYISFISVFSSLAYAEPDTDYANALWVAETSGALKISTSDGSVLFQIDNIGDVHAVALDDRKGLLWLFNQRKELMAYDFSGELKVDATIALQKVDADKDEEEIDEELDGEVSLVVDASDGSIWLAHEKSLLHISATGNVLLNQSLDKDIRVLAYDSIHSRIWVATKKQVVAYNQDGVVLLSLSLGKKTHIEDITYDKSLDALWVAQKEEIQRYNAEGQLVFSQKQKEIRHVASDNNGGVWIATQEQLIYLDQSGLRYFELEPFNKPNNGKIIDLVVDLSDQSSWVANKKALSHVSTNGLVLNEINLADHGYKKGHIRALAVYSDTIAPELEITSPLSDSYINQNQPEISIDFSDIGIGVDTTSHKFYVDNLEATMVCTYQTGQASCIPQVAFNEGLINVSTTIKDYAGNESETSEVSFTVDTIPPALIELSPADGYITNQASINITGKISEPVELTINNVYVQQDVDNSFSHNVTLTEGANLFGFNAVDWAGNTASENLNIVLDTISPLAVEIGNLSLETGENNQVIINGSEGSAEPNSTIVITNTITNETSNAIVNADGSFSLIINAASGDQLIIVIVDSAGNTSTEIQVSAPTAEQLPPDPVDIAPKLPDTGVPSLLATVSFLFDSATPVQTGVEPGAIKSERTAVISGTVKSRDNQPLPGVTISVHNEPSLGQTLSRDDGEFDMVVNGGGQVVVNYSKNGYLSVQRVLKTSWQDYARADDVVMIQLDERVTTIDLNSSDAFQVAQGNPVTDVDGTRQATMLFPQGTTATITLEDGSVKSLNTLSVRATEYTVGDNGPEAMPGKLPAASAYTYAVELSADEAIAAGVNHVNFNQPVPVYVTNFLDFPIGIAVPTGYYDQVTAKWIPYDSGLIIKILSIANGVAKLDVDGSGNAATETQLSELNITLAERQQLAQTYTAGISLWRVALTHFSSWDCNWGWWPPSNATSPEQAEPESKPDVPDPDDCDGCIIEAQNQTLGEEIPLTGISSSLNYRSDRVPGRKDAYRIRMRITGDKALPSSVIGVRMVVSVAGQIHIKNYPPQQNLEDVFDWDGKDNFGRLLKGTHEATVKISYVYRPVYTRTPRFGVSGGSEVIGASRSANEIYLSKQFKQLLGVPEVVDTAGLGGMSLSVHHIFDANSNVLFKGDGSKQDRTNLNANINTVIGGGSLILDLVDNFTTSELTELNMRGATDVAFAPDGSYYLLDSNLQNSRSHRVFRVDTNGILTTYAGGGNDLDGNGVPATEVRLSGPRSISLANDGSLYIADRNNHRIRKVDPDGIITTVAGTGQYGFSGDGGPAENAQLYIPEGVQVADDGSIYISDSLNYRIRRVSPDGIINTIAGNGTRGSYGDNGPAIEASLSHPGSITVHVNDEVYFSDWGGSRVRKIDSSGVITTVAGNGRFGTAGDGGLATSAQLSAANDILFDDEGGMYISQGYRWSSNISRIRYVDRDGIITTVAGDHNSYPWKGHSGDGGLAINAYLYEPMGMDFHPNGNLYVAEFGNASGGYLREIKTTYTDIFQDSYFVITSDDGTEIYIFDSEGRHLQTKSTINGQVLYSFEYNTDGYLLNVIDQFNNIIRIERNSQNTPSAIVSADGQITELVINADGYLEKVTNPNGEAYQMKYYPGGLLAEFINPRNISNTFYYDDLGRFVRDVTANNGGWEVNQLANYGESIITMTSAEGRSYQYEVSRSSSGVNNIQGTDYVLKNTSADGTVTLTERLANGENKTTYANGMVFNESLQPDPRFDMQAAYPGTTTLRTPAGKQVTILRNKTANLSDASDPFSVTALSETLSVNGKTYSQNYDPVSQIWTSASPENRTSSVQINPQNQPVQEQVTGFESVQYGYDASGRLEAISQGSGVDVRNTSVAYNAEGYIESITDALTRTTRYEYDLAGRVKKQVLPDLREILYGYDANGNLTSLTPPGKQAHTFGYTVMNQEEDYVPPEIGLANHQTHYTYNRDKDLELITLPDGQLIDYQYHPTTGQLSQVVIPRGNYGYSYSPNSGQLSDISAPDGGQLSYSYDGSLLTSITWAGSITGNVVIGYNNDFLTESRSINGAYAISFGFDNDNLLTQAGDLTLVRNPQHGLIDSTTLGVTSTQHSYTSFAEMESYNANVNASSVAQWQYRQDKLGHIEQMIETFEGSTITYDYGYDVAGRLETVSLNGDQVKKYTYDSNGNRTHVNDLLLGQYDDQDRLLSYDGVSYNYMDNGELISKTEQGATTRYNYDLLGNLMAVALPGDVSIDYVIDGQNRRVGKKVNGNLVQGFLYKDQLNPIAELDGNNNVVSRFVYADKAHVPAYMVKGGATYRIVSDHLGSPRLVVNTADGSIVQRMDYDEWGNVINDTNPGFQPFGFAGGIYDLHTGLVRFGFRDYDAGVGRWTAKDPIGFDGGQANIYVYVGNNPLNIIDPSGLYFGGIPTGPGQINSTNGNGFTFGFGGCLGMVCTGTNSDTPTETDVEISTPTLGAGIKICYETNRNSNSSSCNDDSGATVTLGLGRNLGLSFSKDKTCINIGPSIGLPVTISGSNGTL